MMYYHQNNQANAAISPRVHRTPTAPVSHRLAPPPGGGNGGGGLIPNSSAHRVNNHTSGLVQQSSSKPAKGPLESYKVLGLSHARTLNIPPGQKVVPAAITPVSTTSTKGSPTPPNPGPANSSNRLVPQVKWGQHGTATSSILIRPSEVSSSTAAHTNSVLNRSKYTSAVTGSVNRAGSSLKCQLIAAANTSSRNPAPGSRQSGGYTAKEVLFARLNAKVLSPSRMVKDAASQCGALCISPNSQLAYKIVRVLQSAIYGGVFEAQAYNIAKVLTTPHGTKPEPIKPRVALKIMLRDLEIQHKDSLQENIIAELQFAEMMRGHRNILAYDELWESHSKGIIYVVMPFAEFEDLFEVLRKRSVPFSEPEARWLFEQLFEGARFLHQQGIGFRDHSLENVLMFRSSADGRLIVPKITDPGQAVRLRYDRQGNVLERHAEKLFGKSFRPPEVYREPKLYNPIKVDVFCLGWMLFFAVTKRQPFDRTLDSDPHWPLVRDRRMLDLLRMKSSIKLSYELINLLSSMLHRDFRQRPDFDECLRHPWFKMSKTSIEVSALRGLPPPRKSLPLESKKQAPPLVVSHNDANKTNRPSAAKVIAT